LILFICLEEQEWFPLLVGCAKLPLMFSVKLVSCGAGSYYTRDCQAKNY
jgi:hypothetical protein